MAKKKSATIGGSASNSGCLVSNPFNARISLTKDDFETLVGYFTPKDDILKILRISPIDMDNWCKKEYGLSFGDVYEDLLAEARFYGRIAITRLKDQGHPTAMSIYSKYFAKFEEEQQNKADVIPILGVIPVEKDRIIEIIDNRNKEE